MALLDFFLSRKKNTANIAKERLQIIVAERRRGDAEPHYLPQLRKDILEVICNTYRSTRRWSACSWSSGTGIYPFLS